MAEQAAPETQAEGTQDGAVDQQFEGEFDAERAKSLIENLRKENKGLKGTLRDATPKLTEYERLVAASKSDLERAQESAAEFQRRAEAAERAAMVNEIALSKGLPASLARRLQGDDRESLEADADELMAQFAAQQEPTTRAPRVDPSQGSSARGGAAADPATQFADFIKRQRA